MNVLIVGLGSIAKKHIKAIFEIEKKAKIFALRSSKKSESYESVIDLYDIEDIVKYKIDFIILSTPTARHLDDIKSLIKYKISLFIEKPLYHMLDGLKIIIEQIEKDYIKTYVACNLRFLDSLNYVKKTYLDNSKLKVNEINIYCGSYLPNWRPDKDFKTSYSAIPELGGGVHLDLIHELDYLYWLFGKPIKINKILKNNSSLNIKAIDYANYNCEYNNFVANVILNYYRKVPKRNMEIIFDQKIIEVDILENKVFEDGILIFESKQTILDTYKDQINYFVTSKKQTFNDINEAYEVLKMCVE